MSPTIAIAHADALRRQVATLAEEISPAWPIERFVAVNPLAGIEHLSFAEAADHAQRTFGAPGWRPEEQLRAAEREGRISERELRRALRARLGDQADRELTLEGRTVTLEQVFLADLRVAPTADPQPRQTLTPAEAWGMKLGERLADEADEMMTGWLAAYLDAGKARWAMPHRELGLYGAWRALAPHDPAFTRAARRRIGELPEDAGEALAELLGACRLDAAGQEQLLRALLTRQPGWASHARWRQEQVGDFDFTDLAAVRLACEQALLHPAAGADALARVPAAPAPCAPEADARVAAVAEALGVSPDAPELADALEAIGPAARPGIWQEALEGTFRAELLERIDAGRPAGAAPEQTRAQAVFCIDVRSEVLRRHLEATGPYETIGFAGFFGLAVDVQAFGGDVTTEQCPVLVTPSAVVSEQPDAGHEQEAQRSLRFTERLAAARDAWQGARKGLLAKYVFAEAVGFVTGPIATAKTVAPNVAGSLAEKAATPPHVPTHMDVTSLPLEDRINGAAFALTAMGLVDGFAPIVLLCGHGSTTVNNPHMAALDCGACGGHRGAHNARAMAAVLNDPEVRAGVAAKGITIPDTTWFAAGEHDTATDVVRLLDEEVPASHREALDAFGRDLARASAATAAERKLRLPNAAASRDGAEEALLRSRDWAQIAPEWGLAGCAAFIVGSRELTAGRDFGSRTFLHSYDASADPDDEALTLILTAPLVVAHWIASQYYFSSVAPDQFGAGTKISHNVVSGIGVLSGPGGDLRGGLPWESVGVGERLEHEPMRLLAVVDAPRDRIDGVLAGAPQVERLIDGEWITLVARDDASSPWLRRMPGGSWAAPGGVEVAA